MIEGGNFISIICVTYNAEELIEITIKSILEQTYSNFELIVIDGSSTDKTLSLIKHLYKANLKILTEPDSGIYDAMNKGISLASGDWIYFLNAGDTFKDVDVLARIFSQPLFGSLLFGDTLLKTDNKVVTCPSKLDKSFFFSNTICLHSIFINKRVFDIIGDFNLHYKVISDRDFLFRVFLNGFSFQHVNSVVSIYDQEGFSAKNHGLYLQEQRSFRNLNFTLLDFLMYSIQKINILTK
jgi:glycosyltransferase involved in cell wall biosynthesis